MIRKIIHIDEEKCNGCGACAAACHEGAIGMVDGKARLLRDDYCDGLGNCLPACPVNAITFTEREAAAYDEAAVLANRAKKVLLEGREPREPEGGFTGPGSRAAVIRHRSGPETPASGETPGYLSQWPVQIQLVPVNASYFQGAHLLVAADCSAYACGDFHERFIRGRITLIGCETGRRGLRGEADGDSEKQRHPQRDGCPDGGALLRRHRTGGQNGAAELRQIPALAGCGAVHGRESSQRTGVSGRRTGRDFLLPGS